MANVRDVAGYILEKTGPISAWKLQKLVYYAQAWHCVWEEAPLFSERIEAWANGPVCRALYELHRGRFVLDQFYGANSENLTPAEKETIDSVVAFYGKYDGQQLSDLTHMERPWQDARSGLDPAERGDKEITLEAMSEYYGGLDRGEKGQAEAKGSA
jgi:uncharacterized phage-associated protein